LSINILQIYLIKSVLSEEYKKRRLKNDFPDEIVKMLKNSPKKGIHGILPEKVKDIEEYHQIEESIIQAYNRSSSLIQKNTFDPSISETWKKLLSDSLKILSKGTESVGY
jgi:hypothetical protein